MRKDFFEQLLKEANLLLKKEKAESATLEKEGRLYNVFDVLWIQTQEKYHSRYIADLLNPKGRHGLGDVPVKKFVEGLKDKSYLPSDFSFDFDSLLVGTEYFIGNIDKDYTKGGYIDVILYDNKGNVIAIENKIYHSDEPRQLLRYGKFLNQFKNNRKLLYLTLDGHFASDDSDGGDKSFYNCIDYKHFILQWLEECKAFAGDKPRTQLIIEQYVDVLKNILGMTENKKEKEWKELLFDEKNLEASLAVYREVFNNRDYLVETLLHPKLKTLAEEFGLVLRLQQGYPDAFSFNRACNENIRFDITYDTHTKYDSKHYYGISVSEEWKASDEELGNTEKIFGKKTHLCPYGFSWLALDDGTDLSYWSGHAFEVILSDRFIDFLKKQLQRVIDEKLFERYAELIAKRNKTNTI